MQTGRLNILGGEIVEMPSNPFSSAIASTISFHVKLHLRDTNQSGYVTGEAGGYMVSGERYAPDVAFISKAKQPELVKEGYNPNPPDLDVEVVSPTDSARLLSIKIGNYITAGTLVWAVYADVKEIIVHEPGKPVRVLTIDDTLDGGNVLPGFTLPVRDVFQE